MSLERTPAGKQAYVILAWAYDDPASRAEDAIGRVNRLMNPSLTDQARQELTDVGTMLSRLAGSLRTIPARTISSQVDQ